MCEFNKKNDGRRIDPCMRKAISNLNQLGVKTLFSCCGHGRYPVSLIVDIGIGDGKVIPLEIFSNIALTGKRFYKKDKNGFYFIPEVIGRIEEE